MADGAPDAYNTGLVPPPPGQTADFSGIGSPPENALKLYPVLIILVTLFTLMRLVTRIAILRSCGVDDLFVFLSWASCMTFFGLQLYDSSLGFGRHLWNIPIAYILDCLKFLTISQWFYLVVVALIKIAFFLSYNRLFAPHKWVRYFNWFGIFAVVIVYVAMFFRSVFLCDPVAKAWNTNLAGSCSPIMVPPIVTGVFNIVSDLYILIVPLPIVWRLQLPLRGRVRLLMLFSLGIFACVMSIIRFAQTFLKVNAADVTFEFFYLGLWGCLELAAGQICLCAIVAPAFWNQAVIPLTNLSLSSLSSLADRSRSQVHRESSSLDGFNHGGTKTESSIDQNKPSDDQTAYPVKFTEITQTVSMAGRNSKDSMFRSSLLDIEQRYR